MREIFKFEEKLSELPVAKSKHREKQRRRFEDIRRRLRQIQKEADESSNTDRGYSLKKAANLLAKTSPLKQTPTMAFRGWN